jgi:hypothetical protein
MKILISGSTGLIGTALIEALVKRGDEPHRLMRSERPMPEPTVVWNPSAGSVSPESLEGFDAAVHLAGKNLAEQRWNERVKQEIYASRVDDTRLLSETLASLSASPRHVLVASAVGVYGDRGDEVLTENSTPGDDFLAKLCVDWEAAAYPAEEAGIAVTYLRTGLVLTPKGGPLAKMLPPFKLGIAGIIGDGKQYVSWLTLGDAVAAILHLLDHPAVTGPVNLVTPHPVTNHELTKTLGKVLSRPTIFPMPAFAARLAFGELADAVLASTRAQPTALQSAGFEYQHPHLEAALRAII